MSVMRAVAAAAVVVAAAAVAAAVTTSADLVGVYEKVDASAFLNDSICPSTLRTTTFEFDQFADKDFLGFDYFHIKIPHRSQKIGASACTSSGAIWAVDSTHPTVTNKRKLLEEWATAHKSGFRTWMAGKTFLELAVELSFVLGYDYVERECGSSSMRAGAVYLWIEPPYSVELHPEFTMKKNQKYLLMTFAEFDEDHGCVYLGGELASNTGSIAPGPVTDPSREKGFKLGGAKESATPEADNGDVKNGSASAAGDGKSGTVFGEPTNPSTKDSSSKCFPAVATVELESGVTVRMDALAVGDRVKVGVDKYSEVIMFSHALGAVESEFISLTTASGATLTLTGGHYLYANGELVAASAVNVGDRLTLASGAESPVTHVSAARGVGLYNPQTLHGDVVVDGVVSSTYTTAVKPGLAHGALLAPARALFRLRLGSALVGLLDEGASALAHLLPGGAVVA